MELSGFKDTIIEAGGREMPSKLPQFSSIYTSAQNLELGIVGSCKVMQLAVSDNFYPVLSMFGGFEGQDAVLETSILMSWQPGDNFQLYGGVSSRDYPLSDRALTLSPHVGVKALF